MTTREDAALSGAAGQLTARWKCSKSRREALVHCHAASDEGKKNPRHNLLGTHQESGREARINAELIRRLEPHWAMYIVRSTPVPR